MAFAVCCGLAALPRPAQAVLIRQSLAGALGGSVPMAPTSFVDMWNPGYGMAGSIRLRIVPRFHANLEVSYWRHPSNKTAFRTLIAQTRPNVTLSGYDLWVLPVSLVGELDLFRRGSTKPYLSFGLGFYNFGVTDAALSGPGADDVELPDPTETAWGVQLGVGVRTPVALGVTLFLDASYHLGFTEGDVTAFLPLRLGLQF